MGRAFVPAGWEALPVAVVRVLVYDRTAVGSCFRNRLAGKRWAPDRDSADNPPLAGRMNPLAGGMNHAA